MSESVSDVLVRHVSDELQNSYQGVLPQELNVRIRLSREHEQNFSVVLRKTQASRKQ